MPNGPIIEWDFGEFQNINKTPFFQLDTAMEITPFCIIKFFSKSGQINVFVAFYN